MRSTHLAVVVAVSLGACGPRSQATVTLLWNNPTGGLFTTSTNWTPVGTPDSNTECDFGLAASYLVTLPQNQSVFYSSVYRGDVTFDGLGHTLSFLATNSITNPGFFVRCEDPQGLTAVHLLHGTFSAMSCGVGDGLGTEAQMTIGSGAILQVHDDFALASYNGTGRLTITNGGQLRVTNGGINFGGPQQNVATGHATVTGSGSSITTPILAVGLGYTGSMLVDAGAQVTNTKEAIVGAGTGAAQVAIRGVGSVWRHTGSFAFTVGVAGSPADRSRLAVLDGGLIISDAPIEISNQGSLSGNSTVQAAVTNNGSVSPGALFDDISRTVLTTSLIGSLTIAGAYSQSSSAKLGIEIGGTGIFDTLTVGGTANLAGILNVTLVNGFVPQPGSTFPFFSSAGRVGSFGTANLPALPVGEFWSLQYSTGGASLTVVPGPSTALVAVLPLVCCRRRRSA